jgi:hypothetical protein
VWQQLLSSTVKHDDANRHKWVAVGKELAKAFGSPMQLDTARPFIESVIRSAFTQEQQTLLSWDVPRKIAGVADTAEILTKKQQRMAAQQRLSGTWNRCVKYAFPMDERVVDVETLVSRLANPRVEKAPFTVTLMAGTGKGKTQLARQLVRAVIAAKFFDTVIVLSGSAESTDDWKMLPSANVRPWSETTAMDIYLTQ